ncbi:MAG: aspartate aminotransferase family protein [Solibacterales bacterium]|nr:aspartate aminotransferase family protein [Bryobacterales bacterium]
MPFTANRDFKTAPRLQTRSEGVYYWNEHGDKILDGCSGLFNVAAGHNRPEIREAVYHQLGELDYAPHFQLGFPDSFELARQLSEITPGDLNHIFYTCSGSDAVETSLKIALAYHRARGDGHRVRLVGRERAYHGVNFGGLSVSGIGRNKEAFGAGLSGVHHIAHTWLPENRFIKGQPEYGAHLANDLERLAQTCGDTIAACIVEPVAGSTGVLVPPKGYLERLREICDFHGILLIFDEVITGFGRLGTPFGADAFGVTPDLMTMAKAITNGCLPMGAVATKDSIYETITEAADEGLIELFHGYTYSAAPVVVAAALATQEIYRREGLFERAQAMTPIFLDALFSLKDLPIITDIRGYGMLGGVDLAPDGKVGHRGHQTYLRLYEAGLQIKATGDALMIAPPLIVESSHVEMITERLKKVLSAI